MPNVGQWFANNSSKVKEVLNNNITQFMAAVSPVWKDSIASSQGVGSADELGRDLLIRKTYQGSLAGVIEQSPWAGTDRNSQFGLFGDNDAGAAPGGLDKLLLQPAVSNTFPDAGDGPMAKSYRLTIPLNASLANLQLTLAEMQADATSAVLGEVIAPKMVGFARNITQNVCNQWYVNENDNYALAYGNYTTAASYALVAANGTETGFTPDGSTARVIAINGGTLRITFTPHNLAVDRFMVGMRVDMYQGNGTVRVNEASSVRVPAYVTRVDEIAGTVTVHFVNRTGSTITIPAASLPPSGAASTTAANYFFVVPANTRQNSSFRGIAGLNSWIKGGVVGGTAAQNSLLGNDAVTDSLGGGTINVLTHPEFKSLTRDMGGQPLTEHELRKILRRFKMAKRKYGHTIDFAVMSDGVLLAYEQQKIGREILDRTGRTSSLSSEGSKEGMTFVFDGDTYTFMTDSYVEAGSCYMFKKGGNNWKRYAPPSPKGTKGFDKLASFIPFEFVAPALTGTSSLFMPIQRLAAAPGNTLVTEAVQMPGQLRMQLVPDQVTGIKLTNLAEDRTYGD
jgi:hypothetical protein